MWRPRRGCSTPATPPPSVQLHRRRLSWVAKNRRACRPAYSFLLPGQSAHLQESPQEQPSLQVHPVLVQGASPLRIIHGSWGGNGV